MIAETGKRRAKKGRHNEKQCLHLVAVRPERRREIDASALAESFIAYGVACEIRDGDVVRRHLSRDLGFSRQDRRANVRRVADLCRELNKAGTLVIAALISRYRDDRNLARRTVGEKNFIEVYLATPLAVCEQRDPKRLYRQARARTIAGFTGVSHPYEPPLDAGLLFDTAALSLAECVALTTEFLAGRWERQQARGRAPAYQRSMPT